MFKSTFYEEYIVGAVRDTVDRTVTKTDIVLYAGQTGDFFPHHMDAECCKTQDFGQRIAHGILIFSMGVGMTAGEVNPEAFSYGYDKPRFVCPIMIGDTIRVRVTIKDKRDYGQTARVWHGCGIMRGYEPASAGGSGMRTLADGEEEGKE